MVDVLPKEQISFAHVHPDTQDFGAKTETHAPQIQ